MIKTIAFDIGGVIAMPKKIKYSIAKKLKFTKKEWERIALPIIIQSAYGEIKGKKALSEIIRKLNGKITISHLKREYADFYKKTYRWNESILQLSKKLKKKNYKIILISNLWRLAKENLADDKKLKHFDFKIISCEVGSRKPEQKIFKISLKKSKTLPEEMLFIDNTEANLISAGNLGIKTILFKNNRQLLKELKRAGIK